MKNKIKILVTGCGGDIGQSVGKILKSIPYIEQAVGCDISDEHAGRFIFDSMHCIAPCSNDSYPNDIDRLVEEHRIDYILPMSEPELRMLTVRGIEDSFRGKPLICANLKAREVGFDKYETAVFLKNAGLPFPETQLLGTGTNINLPVILKSRKGSGSKSVFVVKEKEDFTFYQTKYTDFVAQELIADSPEEFTCGLFRSTRGVIRTIIYKRKLVDSYSGYGEVVENNMIEQLLHSIAEKLDLRGSINVQLKLSSKGPLVFEINPRFSSTVLFRHLMGFQDLLWSLEDAMSLPVSEYSVPQTGTKFYKGFSEYIS